MTNLEKLLGLGLASFLLHGTPALAREHGRHGADDKHEHPRPEPGDDKGAKLARHGADDKKPEHPRPEPGDDKGAKLI